MGVTPQRMSVTMAGPTRNMRDNPGRLEQPVHIFIAQVMKMQILHANPLVCHGLGRAN